MLSKPRQGFLRYPNVTEPTGQVETVDERFDSHDELAGSGLEPCFLLGDPQPHRSLGQGGQGSREIPAQHVGEDNRARHAMGNPIARASLVA